MILLEIGKTLMDLLMCLRRIPRRGKLDERDHVTIRLSPTVKAVWRNLVSHPIDQEKVVEGEVVHHKKV